MNRRRKIGTNDQPKPQKKKLFMRRRDDSTCTAKCSASLTSVTTRWALSLVEEVPSRPAVTKRFCFDADVLIIPHQDYDDDDEPCVRKCALWYMHGEIRLFEGNTRQAAMALLKTDARATSLNLLYQDLLSTTTTTSSLSNAGIENTLATQYMSKSPKTRLSAETAGLEYLVVPTKASLKRHHAMLRQLHMLQQHHNKNATRGGRQQNISEAVASLVQVDSHAARAFALHIGQQQSVTI